MTPSRRVQEQCRGQQRQVRPSLWKDGAGLKVAVAIKIVVDDDEVVGRWSARRLTRGCCFDSGME